MRKLAIRDESGAFQVQSAYFVTDPGRFAED
jgi:hypothetical protein